MVAFELCKAGPRLVILMIFHHKSNLTEILFCCNSIPFHQIATMFCTCHDSYAVMACAQFCSHYFITCWLKTKFSDKFELWRKILVKWVPHLFHLRFIAWNWNLKKAYQIKNQIFLTDHDGILPTAQHISYCYVYTILQWADQCIS